MHHTASSRLLPVLVILAGLALFILAVQRESYYVRTLAELQQRERELHELAEKKQELMRSRAHMYSKDALLEEAQARGHVSLQLNRIHAVS